MRHAHQPLVEAIMRQVGGGDADPRHVMAWVLVGLEDPDDYPGSRPIEDLSAEELRGEVEAGVELARGNPEESEALARSYGL